MKNAETAIETFQEGFVCSQAVLSTFAERYGLKKEQAFKIATPFGGGVANSAGICGAVTGALMVIGLAHGRVDVDDMDSKVKTYEISRQLMAVVEKQFGSTVCNQILEEDISTEEGMERAREKDLFGTTCCDLIKLTVETLEKVL